MAMFVLQSGFDKATAILNAEDAEKTEGEWEGEDFSSAALSVLRVLCVPPGCVRTMKLGLKFI
jgi:hypothetical protein